MYNNITTRSNILVHSLRSKLYFRVLTLFTTKRDNLQDPLFLCSSYYVGTNLVQFIYRENRNLKETVKARQEGEGQRGMRLETRVEDELDGIFLIFFFFFFLIEGLQG